MTRLCMTVALMLSCAHPKLRPQEDLARLLQTYDATPPGPGREQLSNRIDALAGQRYAAWSRLYWHRDLEAAKAEAAATGRPILSLRMLGRLDEELSCANSRFFRIALYANASVSRYLREHYVLHWSSERPVPVARIDFGDGRVLERPVAGNSAHYVLDWRGRPVDVLPGLYTPALFEEQLRRAEPVAIQAGSLDDAAQARAVASFHRSQQKARPGLFEATRAQGHTLAEAERLTMSKSIVEMPMVRAFGLGSEPPSSKASLREDVWLPVGQRLARELPGSNLDENSRALIAFMGASDRIPGFEKRMHADAAFNELTLHQTLHGWLANGEPVTFAALNERVYRELFLTPANDPWLGMDDKEAFSALWRNGVR